MTTLAWDGKTLAADSRISQGTMIISDSYSKIYSIDNAEYFDDVLVAAAFAGVVVDIHKFLASITSDNWPHATIEHELSAIIIGHRNVYTLEPNSNYLIRYEHKTKLSIGSGSPFALSALMLGLDAKSAVKHAIKLDMASGGKVRTLETTRK